jgi:hypothetical protein
VVELPFAADCCPCVEKLRTVLPLPVGIRDSAVHLVSTVVAPSTTLGVRGGRVWASWPGRRVDLVDSHGKVERPLPSNHPRCEQVVPLQLHHLPVAVAHSATVSCGVM